MYSILPIDIAVWNQQQQQQQQQQKTLYERLLRVLVKPHSETSIWKTILTFIGTLLDLDYNIQ